MSSSSISGEEKLLSGRILVVEDSEINRFILKKILTKWGLTIDFAENGEIALQKVATQKYDTILMDVQMPVMTGTEATVLIREMNHGEFKGLPIIALTATILEDDITKIYQAGMTGYIAKPFEPHQLRMTIEKALGN